MIDSSTLIAPLRSSPTYLLVDSSTTEDGSWVRSKFGSFKCSMTNLTSFWRSGILHVWTLWTCLVAEMLSLASSMCVEWSELGCED